MDKDLSKDARDARKFVFETMKKVRDGGLEVNKAAVINKGAREMVMLGRLELECEEFQK